MRLVLQCLVAALAALAVPLADALWIRSGLAGPPLVNPDGSIDNAPERAAMFFLMLSPVFLVILFAFFAVSTSVLRYFARLSLGRLYLLDLSVALAVAIYTASRSYVTLGARDAAFTFEMFGLVSFVCLALGSTAWWLLRPAALQVD